MCLDKRLILNAATSTPSGPSPITFWDLCYRMSQQRQSRDLLWEISVGLGWGWECWGWGFQRGEGVHAFLRQCLRIETSSHKQV